MRNKPIPASMMMSLQLFGNLLSMDANENHEKTNTERKVGRGRLTTERTFVLQFREPTNEAQDWIDGRVEHIVSGRATLFQSKNDLLAFIEDALGEMKQ